ncbi:MAG: outer membrane beta-barrel protein [Candidatus Cryptobacteroides sp.]
MEDWSNRLSDRFNGYEIPEPEGLWEGIDATVTRRQRVRTILLWSGVAGSVAAAAIALFVLLNIYENVPAGRMYADRIEVLGADGHNEVWTEDMPTAQRLLSMNVRRDDGGSGMPSEVPAAEDETVFGDGTVDSKEEAVISEDLEVKDNEISSEKDATVVEDGANAIEDDFFFNEEEYKKRQKGKISASMTYGNGAGSNGSSQGYRTFFLSTGEGLELNANGATAGIMNLNGKETPATTQTKHHLPVRAGLSIRWEFYPKLSLETGLVYTLLSSEMTSGSERYNYVSKQKLNNIGIPLNINYTFLDTRFFGLYVSAGGMMEKCVGGKLSTDYISNGNIIRNTYDRLKVDPLQWSVNLSAGLQFNIIRSTGIFIQPGISWYFDNGSPVETIYKTKPVNFDLRFGISYSF